MGQARGATSPQGDAKDEDKPTIGRDLVTGGIGLGVLVATAFFGDSAKKLVSTSPDAFSFMVLAGQAGITTVVAAVLVHLATINPWGWRNRQLWAVFVIGAALIPALSFGVVKLQPVIGEYYYYQRAVGDSGDADEDSRDATPTVERDIVGDANEDSRDPIVEREIVQRIALLRQAIALNPDLLGAHYHLGRLLTSVGSDIRT